MVEDVAEAAVVAEPRELLRARAVGGGMRWMAMSLCLLVAAPASAQCTLAGAATLIEASIDVPGAESFEVDLEGNGVFVATDTAAVTVIATGHEAHNAPLTIVIALLCFAVAGHRLPQLARELAADENEKARSASPVAPQA